MPQPDPNARWTRPRLGFDSQQSSVLDRRNSQAVVAAIFEYDNKIAGVRAKVHNPKVRRDMFDGELQRLLRLRRESGGVGKADAKVQEGILIYMRAVNEEMEKIADLMPLRAPTLVRTRARVWH